MHVDDRLATVLRHRAGGERAARTQFRQLIDLLGRTERARDEGLLAAAWLRLGALGETIPAAERAAMLREPGLRIRSPKLAAHLAQDEPEVAAAAFAILQLLDEEWRALIPRLPIRARGFLRLRRDLSPAVEQVLESLGVYDRGLTFAPAEAETSASTHDAAEPDSSIGGLVKRIEAFQRARATAAIEPDAPDEAPLLPLGEDGPESENPPFRVFDFTTNAQGAVDWADEPVAPMVFGLRLAASAGSDSALATRIARRQPLRQMAFEIEGAPRIAGKWIIDAAPRFTGEGRFYGYAGRFRRAPEADCETESEEADQLRQLLHELRTPVNAIQGFAEVIQQQLFGPVPPTYRSLAANIAGDAAAMLAGLEELERLARLDAGALELDEGQCDLVGIVSRFAGQLDAALQPLGRRVELACELRGCFVEFSCADAEALAWRLLATIAGAAARGETIAIECDFAAGRFILSCTLPRALAEQDDIFTAGIDTDEVVLSGGSFGTGFALRLARAEARAARGDLVRENTVLNLILPARIGGEEGEDGENGAGHGARA